MKCEEVERLMIDFLDHSLDQSQYAEVEKHIGNCERCLGQIRDLGKIMEKMDSEKMEIPNDTLRINFYHMLKNEIKKNETENATVPKKQVLNTQLILRIAASILLFLAGSATGALVFNNGKGHKSQIAELKSDMGDMKKLMMLSMLKDESASQRIQAVSYSDELSQTDPQILNALTHTLNEDKNINVRIAAAYSLSKFTHEQSVRDTLVASLGKQTEPIIQVILMNILVDMKEQKAVSPMKKIMSDEKTLQEVKDVAQKSIGVLL